MSPHWYESTKVCLEYLYDNVVEGGYVIIDDHGWFPGCKRALDEFIEARKLKGEFEKGGLFTGIFSKMYKTGGYRSLISFGPRRVTVTLGLAFVVLIVIGVAILSRSDMAFTHIVIDINTPEGVSCKAAGDIDGDGFVDVVVGGNLRGGSLVWYHYPDWTKHVIDTGQFAVDCQVGDINGDGYLDVIVSEAFEALSQGKALVWYENPGPSGDPRTALWKRHIITLSAPVDQYIHDVEVGDVNGDGKLDVVVRRGKTVLYIQNNPDSWTERIIDIGSPGAEGTALADLNGDGRLDVVLNGYWLEAPPDVVHGTWVRHNIDTNWPDQVGVTVADMNGDGRPDVLLAPAESWGRLSWYEAPVDPKNGKWIEHVIAKGVENIHTFKVADMDNDGDLDVITAQMHQSKRPKVSVYINEGFAKKWREQIIATTGSHNLRVADIGNDGDMDIIGANHGGSYHPVEIWENKLIDREKMSLEKGWTYVPVDSRRAKWGDFDEPVWLKYFGLAIGDVTGDGYKDIVSGRYFYRNPGGDMTGTWARVDFGLNVDAMLLVDVDGDGQLDVIAQALPNVYWLKPLDAQGNSWEAIKIGTLPKTEHVNSQGYALGQLVPGGKPEIIVAAGDGIYYFEIPANPRAGNWPRTKIADDASEEGVGVGDINGDGHVDICASGKDGHTVYWWENPGNGKGNWVKHRIGTTVNQVDRIAVADINGDGRPDVVVTEETPYRSASVYWFEQPIEPRSPWTRHTIVTQYSTNSLDVADMDNDGDTDIIIGEHRGSRKLAIWENVNRGSSWIEHVIDAGKESHLGARVADLDGDGDLDIVSIAWDEYPYLHVWRNDAMVKGAPSAARFN